MARYIDVDKIDWQEGVFVNPRTKEPILSVIHKIATIEMLRDWQQEEDVRPVVRGEWIAEYDKLDGHFRTYHCSNCGNLQGYTSNFCEECGSENLEV